MADKAGRHIAPPQQFTAKRKGYYYAVRQELPISTANCTIINPALDKRDKNYRLYLWLYDFTTGYKLMGEHGQGPSSRAFYAHQVGQDNLVIKCQFPSNYAYDLMVEFMTAHHQSALDSATALNADANGTTALKLYLREDIIRSVSGASYQGNSKKIYNVFAPVVQAGAERFQNARDYTIEFLVVNNYLETKVQTATFNQLLSRYRAGFFPKDKPVEFVQSDSDVYDLFNSTDSLFGIINNESQPLG